MRVYLILFICGVSQIFGNDLPNEELYDAGNDNGVNMINFLFAKLNVILEDNNKIYTNLIGTYKRLNDKNLTMESLMEETLQKQSQNFNIKLQISNEIWQVKTVLLQVFQKQREDFALQRLKDQIECFKKTQLPIDEYILEREKSNNDGFDNKTDHNTSLSMEPQNIDTRIDKNTDQNTKLILEHQNIDNQTDQMPNLLMELKNYVKRMKEQTTSMQTDQERAYNLTTELQNERHDKIENIVKMFSENVAPIQKSLIKLLNPPKYWTPIQRRQDGSVDFYRNWAEYKTGFGNTNGEFFIGLDKLYQLTENGVELLIIMEDFVGEIRYAKYSKFEIGDEDEKYELKQWGGYSGNAGDSLIIHRNEKFSTKDQDNDRNDSEHCAPKLKGAWWFFNCLDFYYERSNLNGLYLYNNDTSTGGITWSSWHGPNYSLKYVEMLVR